MKRGAGGVFVCLGFLLSSCGGGGSITTTTPVSAEVTAKTDNCKDYAEVPYDFGFLKNNVWNAVSAGGYAWSQCIEQRSVNGATQYGWSWKWPLKVNDTVYGYPQIATGGNAWNGTASKDARFPMKIADTQSIRVSYDLETTSTGGYNTAVSMWLVEGGQLQKSAIRTEFMIWSTWTPSGFLPGGKKRAEVEIDGRVWEVWAQENWGDASGANSNSWTYIAYRSKLATNSITYDAKKLLADAASRGLTSASYYVSDLELGNEAMGGQGHTWVKSYTLDIQ